MDMKSANTFRPGRQIALLLALFALMNPALSEIPSTNPTAGDEIQRSSIPPIISTNSFPCRPMTCSVAFLASIWPCAAVVAAEAWDRGGRNPD